MPGCESLSAISELTDLPLVGSVTDTGLGTLCCICCILTLEAAAYVNGNDFSNKIIHLRSTTVESCCVSTRFDLAFIHPSADYAVIANRKLTCQEHTQDCAYLTLEKDTYSTNACTFHAYRC